MRRLLVFIIIIQSLSIATAALSDSGPMSVQVRSSELRDSPSFLGNRVARVAYGEHVEVINQQGDWMEAVAPNGRRGWLHQSALTKKRIIFSSGATDAKPAATGEELALVGKGFNANVEEKFRGDHKDIDFTWVDRMEQIVIAPREKVSFFEEGGLKPQTGGAR